MPLTAGFIDLRYSAAIVSAIAVFAAVQEGHYIRTGRIETKMNNDINREEIHHMKLDPAPYEMIKSGSKTTELRLFDEKRRRINPGDTIVFTNNETGEKLFTRVLKLHCFKDFEELYKALPLMQCGYSEDDIDKASPSDMEQYYSIEEQRRYGVVGIELSRLELTTDE